LNAKVTTGLPPGSILVAAGWDPFSRSWALDFHHPAFTFTEPGSIPEMLSITYEVKSVSALTGSDLCDFGFLAVATKTGGGKVKEANHETSNFATGKYVIVRTYSAGVFAGTLVARKDVK
jgi:hypothetical protein